MSRNGVQLFLTPRNGVSPTPSLGNWTPLTYNNTEAVLAPCLQTALELSSGGSTGQEVTCEQHPLEPSGVRI